MRLYALRPGPGRSVQLASVELATTSLVTIKITTSQHQAHHTPRDKSQIPSLALGAQRIMIISHGLSAAVLVLAIMIISRNNQARSN